jgi:4-amino-4-deoxy-L-arabinose transferase-like glycosyltransferase
MGNEEEKCSIQKARGNPMGSYTARLLSLLNEHKILAVILTITYVLCFFNQPYYPAIGYDEGIFLHAPKNLVLYGQYATLSSEGLKPFDQQLSGIGPTVVWPIAWIFSIWGIGLSQARAVIGAYTLLAVGGLYLLGLELTSRRATVLALLLFLGGFVREMLWLSRAVMGELPALAFIALGLWAWLRATRAAGRKATIWLVVCGLLLGAAVTTKPQSIVLISVFGLLWFLDRVYYRALSHRYFMLPVLTSALFPALWYAFQALTLMHSPLAPGANHAAQLVPWLLPSTSLFAVSARLMTIGVKHYFFIWGPAVAYTLLTSADRSQDGLRRLLVPLTIGGWITWWVFGSVGWIRYAFIPLALTVLPTAILADKALGNLNLSRVWLRNLKPTEAYPVFVGLALLGALGFGLVIQARTLQLGATTVQQDFAALVERMAPKQAIIESWEWELDFLTDRTFHHPPLSVDATAILPSEPGEIRDFDYDWQAIGSTYLIYGPHAKNYGLYKEDLAAGCCESVAALGEYELYRVIR